MCQQTVQQSKVQERQCTTGLEQLGRGSDVQFGIFRHKGDMPQRESRQRTLLGAPGIATSNKCLTSSNKKLVERKKTI